MKLHLPTAVAMALAFAGFSYAEEVPADESSDLATIETMIESLESVDDAIFDQYVNLGDLGAAWTYLDAEKLAEIGMGLAKAERILFRTHPAVTSKEVLKVAVRTAGVTNKPETLEQLREFAEKADNAELLEQIELAQQLAGGSRSIAPKLSLDDVTIGAFLAYKQAKLDMDAAMVFGSAEKMRSLQERLEGWKDKDPEVWTDMLQFVTEQADTMEALGAPSRGGPDDMSEATDALNQLTAVSRGSFRPFPGGGNAGFNPNGFNNGPRFPAVQPGFGSNPGFVQPGIPGGGGFVGGQQFGQRTNINYQQQQQVRFRNPGAMLVGGILGAVGQGVGQKDPQAGAILGGIGGTLQLLSEPTVNTQGNININQQGFRNQFGGFN